MIVHVYPDKSEAYQPEVGDEVVITDVVYKTTMGGIALDLAKKEGKPLIGTVVRLHNSRGKNWMTQTLEVSYDPEWGPTTVLPWMIKPTGPTLVKARRVEV